MKQRFRRVLIGLAALLVVGATVVAVFGNRDSRQVDSSSVIPTIPAEAGNEPVGTAAPITGGSGGRATAAQAAAESPALDVQRPASAELVVTYSGFDVATGGVLVGAVVSGLLESGGECTLTLTDGATERTVTVEAVPDARTTSCGELALNDMTPGRWTGEATYATAGGDELSGAVEVVVP